MWLIFFGGKIVKNRENKKQVLVCLVLNQIQHAGRRLRTC